ncbi:AraC-like DNA-binding protein [Nocardioides zeae]|uniref:AraC-like DNA-binding protein n=1 Tax=Nocardioides zeae TaxID=1457234 RepID=A0ACC6IF96_9ACTN|nr:AraC family transcriptional regulator [Nocardioides zeae]MDR6174872.1 AraC-like DNA-binding protein [Nocardioides zeae]MDR6209318.1 AraC-like DNA-binding protein [Nocardioides zeae]
MCEDAAAARERPTPTWDEFSAAVEHAYFPHHLTVRSDRPPVGGTLRSVDLGPVRLARIGWGSEVSVESDHPGAWAVNVPRSGVLEASVGGRHVLSLDGQATVCPPDVTTSMTRWSADCAIVGMRVDADHLAQEIPSLVGLSVTQMPAQVDLRRDAGRAWVALLTSIGGEMLRQPTLLADSVVNRRLGSALTAAFVLACFPDSGRGPVRPRIVTQVLDAMEADPAADWTAAELAAVAGVGIRRLQDGFRTYLGMTPTQALSRIRLARVHADLLAGRSATVADAAHRWGFTHLGRFAAAYRARYGVAPSATLRG